MHEGGQLIEVATQAIADGTSTGASHLATILQLGKQLGSSLTEAKQGFIDLGGGEQQTTEPHSSSSSSSSSSSEYVAATQEAAGRTGEVEESLNTKVSQSHVEIPEAIKIFEEKYGHYRQRIKIIAETGENVRVPYPKDWIKWDEWANDAYDAIRACSDDVVKIAQNTGIHESKIARIKQHLFYDESHILSVEQRVGRFAADHEIAAAWNRLAQGDFIGNDIKLLQHEYFESRFEKLFKTDYDTAHRATQNDTKGRPWFKPEYKE